MLSKILILLFTLASFSSAVSAQDVVRVGSKRFTENYLLAEIFSQLLESQGYQVERRFGLAGTMVAFNALKAQEIDVYPDYTGTLTEALLKGPKPADWNLNRELEKNGMALLPPLGFDNNYTLVMTQEMSQKLQIQKISDLKKWPHLRGAFSHEFMARKDGWYALKKIYNLQNAVQGLEVPLTYSALQEKKVDFAEAYSTEPLIEKMNLVSLVDNKNFLPKYSAAPVVHQNVSIDVRKQLSLLADTLPTEKMLSLNNQINQGKTFESVAQSFLQSTQLLGNTQSIAPPGFWSKMAERTKDHLLLTGLAVLLATGLAVPLASFFAGSKRASKILLSVTGVLQTIPSIALLTFMIPFFGIGFKPALIGLFIYSLLPILRNTHTAMTGIDPVLITSARGIGLYPMEIFLSVKLPLAFPTILAGIRTATILNIGTATLAAFIGAGGLGEPIVTGLALNDSNQVLQGAIPAAILAILIDSLFGLVDRYFSPQIPS